MARSGIAAVKLLREHGASVREVDEKATGKVWGIKIEPQPESAFQGADLVVISPGVPADLDLLNNVRARGVRIIGELELAAPFLKGKTMGITGSNGKTTTTALTGHVLRESGIACQVGGNIGTPPAAMVETSREDQWNVLELSSFQLETIETFRADIAACLNVTPDHLDRHYTLEKYAAAKGRLFETQQAADSAVLNADDPACETYANLTRATVQWFSSEHPVSPGAWLENGEIRLNGDVLMNAKDIPLRGRHNIENSMAASIAAWLAGASLEQIAAAIRTFPGVQHRLGLVPEIGGRECYNDCKANNDNPTPN